MCRPLSSSFSQAGELTSTDGGGNLGGGRLGFSPQGEKPCSGKRVA